MNAKKSSKKMVLKKHTIANLDAVEMKTVKGGKKTEEYCYPIVMVKMYTIDCTA